MEAEFECFSGQGFEEAILVLAFVPVLSGIDVLEAVLEGAVDLRASLRAVAVMALGAPSAAFMRRR